MFGFVLHCVTQPAHAPPAPNRSAATVAMQRRQWHFGLTLDRVEFNLGRQYITPAGLLGTLMSHYLCWLRLLFLWLYFPLPLSVPLLATGMVEAPSSAALVARRRPALAGQACLRSTICTAVALTTVAWRAHTHFRLAAAALERAGTQQGRAPSSHRVLPLEPHCMPAQLPALDISCPSRQ